MITGKINFSVTIDLDGDGLFTIAATKSGLHTHTSFWGDHILLQQFGSTLARFPATATDRVRFEVGEAEQTMFDYLLLEAYCATPFGHAAVKVVAHTGADELTRERVEFSIPAEVAAINKLGQMLAGWDRDGNTSLEWKAQAD